MNKKLLLFSCSWLMLYMSMAQDSLQIYPTHWWTGMKTHAIQLMLHEKDIAIGNHTLSVSNPAVLVKKISRQKSDDYLFVDLDITVAAKPGAMTLFLKQAGKPVRKIVYQLKARSVADGHSRVQGVGPGDIIYLLMPDRFSNGDTSNDVVKEYRDQICDRLDPLKRHGGDLKGVQNHLGYLKELGITSIWMTPVLENNMPTIKEANGAMAGYHGYWFTDYYQVDKRLGGNTAYHQLINAAHEQGLKIIQDAVYNHIGNYHWLFLDPPSADWFNQWPQLTEPNHREEVIFDQNAAATDRDIMLRGWFRSYLPDLNLSNPYLTKFLIQQAIWWTEEFGIDGWRVDTYKYCDEHFMNTLNDALKKDFPKVGIFGEAWTNSVIGSAYFCRNNLKAKFSHNLPGVTDFPLAFALQAALTEDPGWTQGVNKLYMTLSQDFVYQNPALNVLFLDNHDMNRIYSVLGEDWQKLKMALNWMFTLKPIPQLYYGTEILMKNFMQPSDAAVRLDFPGGWDADPINKFIANGRSIPENDCLDYISRLAHFRQKSPALIKGKLMQYVPDDGLYIYFRYTSKQTVMVVANTGKSARRVNWDRFSERCTHFNKLRNVITDEVIDKASLSIAPGSSAVLELLQ